MRMFKIAFSSIAAIALSVGGVAQAESVRAGASLPVAKAAKVSRKTAKKGVELNQSGDGTNAVIGGAVGVAAGIGIGVAVSGGRKSPS
jgi:hypothetical protein